MPSSTVPVQTSAPTTSPMATPTSKPNPNVSTEFYDFENQQTVLPDSFQASLGAQLPTPNIIWSTYGIDNSVSHSGTKSLKLSSDNSTTRWYTVGRQIPSTYGAVTVSYFVKGKNLRSEANQYGDCYVGFMFTDSNGVKKFRVNPYSGTFDWQQGELQLTADEMQSLRNSGSSISFYIFLSMSGEFWIDDLKFEFVSPTQSK
jgi:hypothetical protein